MIQRLLWSPGKGTTIPAGVAPARATFRIPDLNFGGVARVFNDAATTETFSIGDFTVTNTMQIPLGPKESMFIAFGNTDTHITASSGLIFITPGIGRT